MLCMLSYQWERFPLLQAHVVGCHAFLPRACMCSRGYVIALSAKKNFYLSDTHFRLLFEFTLAAPEVFVASENPVSLPLGTGSASSET